MNDSTPRRWLDPSSDATPGMRMLLECTAHDGPTEAERAALRRKLDEVIASAPRIPTPAPPSSTVRPWMFALLALALVGGAAALLGRHRLGLDRSSLPVPTAAGSASVASSSVTEPIANPSQIPVPTASTSSSPSAAESAASMASTIAPKPTPSTSSSSAEDEIALVKRAYAALRNGDPAGALGLAAEHAKKFPSGMLTQEREVIAIDALVRLGRRAEAVQRANAFRKAFPKSAHLRRIDVLVGTTDE